MTPLLEAIKSHSDWIVRAFATDDLALDYSLESFKTIDSFMDAHTANGEAVPGGRLSETPGTILFAIGAYVGETIIKNSPGSVWVTDDKEPPDAEVHLPGNVAIMPMQRVIKRFRNGAEDGIYAYGAVAIREMAKGDYWEKMKAASAAQQIDSKPAAKPWWKFW